MLLFNNLYWLITPVVAQMGGANNPHPSGQAMENREKWILSQLTPLLYCMRQKGSLMAMYQHRARATDLLRYYV